MTIQQAKAQQDAIDNLFLGLFKAIGALFLHRYFSFVGFWLLVFCLLLSVAPWLGVTEPPSRAFLSNPPAVWEKTWDVLPAWYRYAALGIPVLMAIVLRKFVRPIMRWTLYALIAAIAGLIILKIVGNDEPAPQKAPLSHAAPASADASPAERAQAVRKALEEAAIPETSFTAPGSDQGPREMFEGVDLRVCEMSLGGVEVCQRYCATLEAKDRPSWCK